MTVPDIPCPPAEPCSAQKKRKVPGWERVMVPLVPGAMLPVSNCPPSAVAVWGARSPLVKVTVVPALTVSSLGPKAKLVMLTETATGACLAGAAVGCTALAPAPATPPVGARACAVPAELP